MRSPAAALTLTLNGRAVELYSDPARRLADVLRDDLGLTGTKIGCNAGDCGACTVLLDGEQVCACLVPIAQRGGPRGRSRWKGWPRDGTLAALQEAFLRHGAAQCGICTPGMLMAASDLLARTPSPTEPQCSMRWAACCAAAPATARSSRPCWISAAPLRPCPQAAGRRRRAARARSMARAKLTGADHFGADALPDEPFLSLRAVRSPHAHARFTLGDFRTLHAAHPGLVRVLTAADIPGRNLYGIYPTGKDQPVLADGYVRHRGEAVCALVGDAETLADIRDADLPITWDVAARRHFRRRAYAPDLHAHAPGNVLCRGRVVRGDVERRSPALRSAPTSPCAPASSSTPISSRKPATRGASATASKSSPARRRPTWTATNSRRSWASRRNRCASYRPPSAAASAASSICRCNR